MIATHRNRIRLRLVLLAIVVMAAGSSTVAQRASSFQGEWEWAVYAKSRDELPPAYHNEPIRDVPGAAIYLKIKQRGNKITGEYSASRRFLARLEDGEFDAVVNGSAAELELASGFGGKLTVRLTRVGNRLHWKTVKSDGESYFPIDEFLHRVRKRKAQK